MSQTSRFTRARQLTSIVLPGRRPDGYADQVAGRLRRIAAARGTGMLPFSGRSDGSIYFRDGKVAYAQSTRTPGPAPHDDPAADQPPLTKITAILAITEPTVDAALELLSVQSRPAKFRGQIPVTEVIRAKMRTMESLRLDDAIEDILITLGKQSHLIRLLKNSRDEQGLFLYLVLERQKANLALARHNLRRIESDLSV